jgi:hypothetical protein
MYPFLKIRVGTCGSAGDLAAFTSTEDLHCAAINLSAPCCALALCNKAQGAQALPPVRACSCVETVSAIIEITIQTDISHFVRIPLTHVKLEFTKFPSITFIINPFQLL